MDVLLTIAILGILAHLWSRQNKLQQRIDEMERGNRPESAPERVEAEILGQAPQPIAEPAATPEPVEPPLHIWERHIETEYGDRVLEAEPGPKEDARRVGFEDLFGRKLPIWAGGITLAVAGMLIVKYSIDAGLVSPLVRVIAGLIFGAALIGAAEAALRFDDRVRDPRVRQALAGAGVASLYGAVLIAANLYDLISPVTAFLGMAAVTALAMGLSLRFGAPSALLGLAGGLAAPTLVGSGEPNIPLLSAYLALAIGGLSVLSKSQRWMWLGILALTGGFGWAGLLLIGGTLDTVASISLGLYIVLLGIVLPMVAFSGKLGNAVRIAGSVAAAAQMAGLVATGGFTLLHWGLFGLISAAIIWLAGRDQQLARLPAVGLAIALLLVAAWPDPAPIELATVMVLGTALYGLPALRRLWGTEGSIVEAGQIAALGFAGLIVPMIQFYRLDGSNDIPLALIALGAAPLPAGAAALGWNNQDRRNDPRFSLLATTSALLAAAGAALGLPDWSLAPLVGILGLGLLALGLRGSDPRLERSAWAFAAFALFLLSFGFQSDAEFERLFGGTDGVELAIALARWAGLASVLALFAWKGRLITGRDGAQAAAALLAYGAIAQFPLGDALPIVPAIGLAAVATWTRQLAPNALLPSLAALLLVSLLWAVAPLLDWAADALLSLSGHPMLATNLPQSQDVVLRLLLPALLIALAWRLAKFRLSPLARLTALTCAAIMGAVAFHILFKQLWSIDTLDQFVRFGLAERISWEAVLLGGALLAWQFKRRQVTIGLTAAGLAHFAWYTLTIHNPLLTAQAVGPLPIVNLLLPAYGLPLVWLWLLGHHQPALPASLERIRSALPMLLIILFAFSSLRQLFHGSILTGEGVTSWEDIFRSILAILLGIGFLLRGIRRGSRDWRIASLVIMLAAVAKVFLFDASGLDGLLRIGSFIALGLSLIGIGWLYSRYLGEDPPLVQLA